MSVCVVNGRLDILIAGLCSHIIIPLNNSCRQFHQKRINVLMSFTAMVCEIYNFVLASKWFKMNHCNLRWIVYNNAQHTHTHTQWAQFHSILFLYFCRSPLWVRFHLANVNQYATIVAFDLMPCRMAGIFSWWKFQVILLSSAQYLHPMKCCCCVCVCVWALSKMQLCRISVCVCVCFAHPIVLLLAVKANNWILLCHQFQ